MKTPAPETFEGQILALLPSLRRYSRSLTRSDTDGEDLLQDCVEKVLTRRGQWRGLNLRGWVLTIMTNLYRNGRRGKARDGLVELDAAEDLAASEPPADPMERARLDDALNSLSEEHRAVLMLVVIEGYTYGEVAAALDIPIGTVMSRLSRARRRVAERLKADNIITLRRPK
ncbi:RNA polymerase sigma factor [Rhizobium leguminosarum]|uniref:RNA polymerase sigma factor n=1 Tax=Rhizobium leguminosarum TaxID=384 RepID=UPI00048CBAFA|nr:RNA polymerase sigma factor [Rhizobium leguminosarum]MBY5899344.1 RNA polymerase sigma factor [Rhizobium leguminosarum]MBY5908582.1 RNA polymerase sigma factor [Rhizobium leguminosarum]MBY5917948.1 RNA polymerase sigma factor [Rhizobium leguminosarum]NKK91345.1 sigma-70 family RNA polymerase sigma factor [Rhizobium leguminosarum bv. viciae]OBY07547.1 RNA polymerase subunit sigma-70 [Rhizobium leguminosarum bv. trifolii]